MIKPIVRIELIHFLKPGKKIIGIKNVKDNHGIESINKAYSNELLLKAAVYEFYKQNYELITFELEDKTVKSGRDYITFYLTELNKDK